MADKKVIVYRSRQEQMIDEWLWDQDGYQTIGWIALAFLIIVGIFALYNKTKRSHRFGPGFRYLP